MLMVAAAEYSAKAQQLQLNVGTCGYGLAYYVVYLPLYACACRYDPKEKRYVLMWATALKNPDHNLPKIAYPLFVAVSHSNNPMGEWIIWALDTVPRIAPGLKFCDGQELDKYAANTPQVGDWRDNGGTRAAVCALTGS